MSNIQLRIWIGFIGALILSILPMPELFSIVKPAWALLWILYIEYYLPGQFKLTSLLLLGLLLDALLSSVIGEHSFALLCVTCIASSKSRRFQFFSMVQQVLMVGFFCFLYQSLISCIDGLLGFHYSMIMPLITGLLGAFIWPWVRLLGESTLFIRTPYRLQ